MGDLTTQKTFWERPEGTTGKIFLFLGVLFGGYLLYSELPAIIAILQNTIHAFILGGVLFLLIILALDPKVHNIISFGYRGVMRGITKAFIELDPIAILKTYIEGLKKNQKDMNTQIGLLRGQMTKLKDVITQNESDRLNNMKLAEQAKKTGKVELVALKVRKAGRAQNSNITLQTLYTKMELLNRVLLKTFEAAGIIIEDTEDEVRVKEVERNAILAGHSAFKSAVRIISGDPDKKAMFDQAMEVMVDDIGAKKGEMERMMEMSSKFIDSIDLQNGVYEEDGLKMLEEWQNNTTQSLLLGTEKNVLIAKAENPNDVLDLNAPLPVMRKSTNKYAELLNK